MHLPQVQILIPHFRQPGFFGSRPSTVLPQAEHSYRYQENPQLRQISIPESPSFAITWIEPQIRQIEAISGQFLMPSLCFRYFSKSFFAFSLSVDSMEVSPSYQKLNATLLPIATRSTASKLCDCKISGQSLYTPAANSYSFHAAFKWYGASLQEEYLCGQADGKDGHKRVSAED